MPPLEHNLAPQNYHTKEKPLSRYTSAREVWDDRQGRWILSAYNWRRIALIETIIIIILAGGLIFQSSKATVTPYVVEVGRDGTAIAVGSANAQKYVPKEAEIKYFLNQLVLKTRTVPADSVMYKQNWISAYSYMDQAAANKVNALMAKDPQISHLENKRTVQVNIISILPATNDSWQLRWREDVFNSTGQLESSYTMTGLTTISLKTPKNEKELANNPLGIVVKDLTWSKDY